MSPRLPASDLSSSSNPAASQATKVSVLRFLRGAIINEEKALGRALDDQAVLDVLGRQIRQRRESIELFRQGRRPELAKREEDELSILLTYMPIQLEKEQLVALIKKAIHQVGAQSVTDKGKVMGFLMPQVKGKADGVMVNSMVNDLLSQQND